MSEETSNAGRRAAVFVGVVAILALAIVLAIGAYRRVSAQSNARDDVSRAQAMLEDVDATIRRVDKLVSAQADADIAEELASALEQIPASAREASEAAAIFTASAPRMSSTGQAQVLDAADAALLRARMLRTAEPVLVATRKASLAVGPAEEAWKLLLDAEARADEAVKLYNEHDPAKARKSRQISDAATADVRKARTLFAKSADAMPEAALGPFVAYCDARLAVLDLAKRADDAFLGGDIAKANSLSDEYNAREKDVTAQAKKLPASPAVPISAAYDKIAGTNAQEYFRLREQVVAQ